MAQQIEHLIKMANQVAQNLGANSDSANASECTAEHLRKFWTPAMREVLAAYCRAGGEGVSPVVLQALVVVADNPT